MICDRTLSFGIGMLHIGSYTVPALDEYHKGAKKELSVIQTEAAISIPTNLVAIM